MYITVPAFNVFKNAANIFTAMGDWYFFGSTLSVGIIASIGLMLVGSLMAGFTDLQFSVVGYTWAGLQSVFLAAYVLSIKKVQITAKMSEWEQAFYNNLIGVGIFSAMAVAAGEFNTVWDNENIYKFAIRMDFSHLTHCLARRFGSLSHSAGCCGRVWGSVCSG